jgi:uncharacterized Zn finger protein (UPF0148 family)
MNKLLQESGFRICSGCGYPLVGIAEIGRCPECGERYNLGETERFWKSVNSPLRKRATASSTPHGVDEH